MYILYEEKSDYADGACTRVPVFNPGAINPVHQFVHTEYIPYIPYLTYIVLD